MLTGKMFLERVGDGDIYSWVPTVLIGIVTLYVTSYFLTIRRYPAGPLPLPIFGNVLRFRTEKKTMEVLNELKKRYGDVFTMWFGNFPMVFVCNFDNTKRGLMESKNDFSGRISSVSFDILRMTGKDSMIFSDYSERWERLRKIGHAAIRKYAVTEKLSTLVGDVTDEVAQIMLKEKECFDPKDHIYNLIFNIIASSVYGQRFQMHDKDMDLIRNFSEQFQDLAGNGFPGDFSPLLRLLFIRREIALRKSNRQVTEMVVKRTQEHLKSFQEDDIRDLTDSLIAARAESEAVDKGRYFNDDTLAQMTIDIMGAGVDTSYSTARWIINFIACYPGIQEKAIAEVKERIGDRIPVQNDRGNCPYLSAIIMETLRLRSPVPLGLPHKTTCQTSLGGRSIPKDTAVIFVLEASHADSGCWPDPTIFRPERFLLDGNKIASTTSLSGYVPFGQGRRSCIGEKLATNDLFLIFARLLQKGRFVADVVDLEPLNFALFNVPKENKLRYIAHDKI